MRWKKIDDSYAQNGEYTLCKIGKSKVTFELWHKAANMGIFDTQLEALNKFKEITK